MQVTTIEQSKRLIELGLDPNTADMSYVFYTIHNGLPVDDYVLNVGKGDDLDIPAWSLDALLAAIPCSYQMTRNHDGTVQFMLLTVLRKDFFETELEAVYTMLVWLLENDLLDETKLRNYKAE